MSSQEHVLRLQIPRGFIPYSEAAERMNSGGRAGAFNVDSIFQAERRASAAGRQQHAAASCR